MQGLARLLPVVPLRVDGCDTTLAQELGQRDRVWVCKGSVTISATIGTMSRPGAGFLLARFGWSAVNHGNRLASFFRDFAGVVEGG
jgi:hypothetical protein